jgi:valyl-tRNA synthetase
VRQDEDVLDTWFSSWLWPISTLGWPNEDSPDLKAFYPTDALVTAPEILFFWVARMIMSGYAFMGRAPFHTVYLHGTVRDTNHMKMSKSLGNGIDPLDVVRLYGSDALRWTLIAGMGLGADVILDPADLDRSFATGRNFGTKLWNIGRFLLDRVGTDPVQPVEDIERARLTRADEWILSRLDAAVTECDRAIGPLWPGTPTPSPDGLVWRSDERFAGLRLNEYAETARRFVWSELADWYVEAVKGRLEVPGDDREVARAVLVHTFDRALRLLHPIVPFVTESLWQRLPGRAPDEFLIRAPWPQCTRSRPTTGAQEFEIVREAVLAIRQIRGDNNVPPGKLIEALIVGDGRRAAGDGILESESQTVGRLARADVRMVASAPSGAAAHTVISGGTEIVVPLAGLIDVDRECGRLRTEVAELDKQIASREQRLGNAKYVERAPPHVVASDRTMLDEMKAKRKQLADKVQSLCGG